MECFTESCRATPATRTHTLHRHPAQTGPYLRGPEDYEIPEKVGQCLSTNMEPANQHELVSGYYLKKKTLNIICFFPRGEASDINKVALHQAVESTFLTNKHLNSWTVP